MHEQVLNDQLELIDNDSVLTQDVIWRTCRVQWTIKMNGRRELGKSVLVAQHDEDDDDDIYICKYVCALIKRATFPH